MEIDFIFKSPDHIRFESNQHVSGPHGGAARIIQVQTDKKYEDNYFVTIYNPEGIHPVWQDNIQMAPKQMKIMEINSNKIVLRGWGTDAMGESFANYGLTINIKEKDVFNCILHMYDRSVDIKYLNHYELNDPIDFSFNNQMNSPNKNGVIIENTIDGERIEWTFVNNVKHGQYRRFYTDGKLKENGNLKNGEVDGVCETFHITGAPHAKGQYSLGNPIGWWRFYDENGTLRSEGNFSNGRQSGKWTYYDSKGKFEENEKY